MKRQRNTPQIKQQNSQKNNSMKWIQTIKKDQSEMKNTLEGINIRSDEGDAWLSDVEDKVAEISNQSSKKKKE